MRFFQQRRFFIEKGVAVTTGVIATFFLPTWFTKALATQTTRVVGIRTDEHTAYLPFMQYGKFHKNSLETFDYLARDIRREKIHAMNPLLLDAIWRIQWVLAAEKYEKNNGYVPLDYSPALSDIPMYYLSSGYRTHVTNERVGGADHSQHLSGNAIDGKFEGYSIQAIWQLVANNHSRGGIGKYKNHLHIDGRLKKVQWKK
jgi:uncharacterized protein YcbK (DUF882 family)